MKSSGDCNEFMPSREQQEALCYPYNLQVVRRTFWYSLVSIVLLTIALAIIISFSSFARDQVVVFILAGLGFMLSGSGLWILGLWVFATAYRRYRLHIWQHGRAVVGTVLKRQVGYCGYGTPVWPMNVPYYLQIAYEINGLRRSAWSNVLPRQYTQHPKGSRVAIRLHPTNDWRWVIDLNANL